MGRCVVSSCLECGDGANWCKTWTPTSCCKQRREAAATKPKATPLPWTRLTVVGSALFVNQFGINMIFPFLPFMIHDFFPYLDKTELGHKAGYLASVYFVGTFAGSLMWGWISDRIGRRPVLLFGVTSTIACELFFGFSQNFTWAIMARLLWGMLNGNIGVVKTYVSEICDDTNQAKGFAMLGTSGGISRLMGSVIGGFLARPASKYSVLQVDFFCRFPYSLPCIVGGGISFLSLVCTWLFVDETLVKNKDKASSEDGSDNLSDSPQSNDSGIELLQPGTTDSLMPGDHDYDEQNEIHLFEIDDSESATDSEYDATSDTELLRTRRAKKNFDRFSCEHCKTKCLETFNIFKLARLVMKRITDCVGGFVTCAVCLRTYDYTNLKPSNLQRKSSGYGRTLCNGMWRMFKLILDRRVFLSVSLYGIMAYLAIVSNELLPLLLVTSHEHGGYNMDASEIGVILMVAAIVQLFMQFFVFPRIAKCIGFRHTYKLGCAIFGISAAILPLSNRISGPVSYHEDEFSSGSGSGSGLAPFFVYNDSCGNLINVTDNTTSTGGSSVSRIPGRVWVVIMIITAFIVFARMITITSVMVLISNSTLPQNRGTVNGFGQSAAALGRVVGPIISAPLFAWSETSGKEWPLNYHLMFDLLAVGSVGAIVLCLLLPASAEKKRENDTTTEPAVNVELISEHSSSSSSDEEAL